MKINKKDLKEIIKNYNIYIDFDEVLVEFNEYALKVCNKIYNKNYKIDDIDNWNWYFEKNMGKTFLSILNDKKLYSKVSIKDGAKKFINKMLSISNNVFIVTATNASVFYSKYKFIEKNFPELKNKIIDTTNKSILNYNNAILIDDAPHKNPFFILIIITNIKFNYFLIISDKFLFFILFLSIFFNISS